MMNISLSVRKKYMKSSRYLFPENGRASTIQERVFWQSLSYLVAFLTIWPTLMAGLITAGIHGELPYWFSVTLVVVAPLPGFVNALIYFQPRISLFVYEISHPLQERSREATQTPSVGRRDPNKPRPARIDTRPAATNDTLDSTKEQKTNEDSRDTSAQDEKTEEVLETPDARIPVGLESDIEDVQDQDLSVCSSTVSGPSQLHPAVSFLLRDDVLNDVANRLAQGSQSDTRQLEKIKRQLLHLQMDPSLAISGDLEEQVLEALEVGGFDNQAGDSEISLLEDAVAVLFRGGGQQRKQHRSEIDEDDGSAE
mmetsp:Transcript_5289/g.11772  ORF Transcript_5289/g.11772 Transcript_5289/m.11772 type:complete len:311 (-) Transcript_5289:92-1024(-)